MNLRGVLRDVSVGGTGHGSTLYATSTVRLASRLHPEANILRLMQKLGLVPPVFSPPLLTSKF